MQVVGGLAGPALLAHELDAAALQEVADRVQGALSRMTQTRVTTAAAKVSGSDGASETLVSSSEGRLRPAQVKALRPGEVALDGAKGVHAEVNALKAAAARGQTVEAVAASRPVCASCARILRAAAVFIQTALKAE